MALTTVGRVQQVPELSNLDPGYLQTLVDSASRVIQDYTKQKLEQDTYTEYYSGNNQRDLVLRQIPVQEIINLWFDVNGLYGDGPNAFPSSSLLTLGTQYVLVKDSGGVESFRGIARRIGGTTGGWLGYYPTNYYSGKLAATRLPVWPFGEGNIKVEYTAGFASIPESIQAAVVMLVAWFVRSMPLGGPLSSENLGSYSYSMGSGLIGTAPEMGTVRQMLGPYRDQAW